MLATRAPSPEFSPLSLFSPGPVVYEEPAIRKRVVETGSGIRIAKTVSEREPVDVLLERVRVGQVVDAANIPALRYEGETMIVPKLEEILRVEKRTILKEELRITSTRCEARCLQRVSLRGEEVSVEAFDKRPDQRSTPDA